MMDGMMPRRRDDKTMSEPMIADSILLQNRAAPPHMIRRQKSTFDFSSKHETRCAQQQFELGRDAQKAKVARSRAYGYSYIMSLQAR
jgi:hypothetical protein